MYVCVSSEGPLFWWENYQSCRGARLFFCVWCSKQARWKLGAKEGDFTVTSEHRKMWPFLHAWSASPSSSLIQAISYTVKEGRHFRGEPISWQRWAILEYEAFPPILEIKFWNYFKGPSRPQFKSSTSFVAFKSFLISNFSFCVWDREQVCNKSEYTSVWVFQVQAHPSLSRILSQARVRNLFRIQK